MTGAVMPASNYAARTREKYRADLEDLAASLKGRNISAWQAIGLRDLQQFMAELDRRHLEPSSRNRKTYAMKTLFRFLHQAGYIR
jgi:site-specific recombinase XerD